MVEAYRERHIETGLPQEIISASEEEGFVKDAKRVIGEHLARTVLVVSAVLAGAGATAVEKSGSFDPLASSVNSANHLVLNDLQESYEQLIDKLPEVEKAEAAAVTATCTSVASTTWTCNNPIADGDHIALVLPAIQQTCHANVWGGGVGEGGAFDVHVVVDTMNVNCATFGGQPVPVDATICCGVAAPKTPEPTPIPTPIVGVGGIAKLPHVETLPQESAQSSDNDLTPFEIGGVVAVATALTAATAAFIRKKRSS